MDSLKRGAEEFDHFCTAAGDYLRLALIYSPVPMIKAGGEVVYAHPSRVLDGMRSVTHEDCGLHMAEPIDDPYAKLPTFVVFRRDE